MLKNIPIQYRCCICGEDLEQLTEDNKCPKCNSGRTLKIGKCPICREYGYVNEDKDIVNPFYMCNYCRFEINYCNKHNNKNCFECINRTIKANIEDLDNSKVTERYGCHMGSRFMKLVKKHKLDYIQSIKLLKWRII